MSLPRPECPECGTTDLTWMGGAPPYGDEQWQCSQGHEWTTGPLKATP